VIARGCACADVAPVKDVLATFGLQEADHAVDVPELA